MVVNIVGLVWMAIEAVVITSGSVWVVEVAREFVRAMYGLVWVDTDMVVVAGVP